MYFHDSHTYSSPFLIHWRLFIWHTYTFPMYLLIQSMHRCILQLQTYIYIFHAFIHNLSLSETHLLTHTCSLSQIYININTSAYRQQSHLIRRLINTLLYRQSAVRPTNRPSLPPTLLQISSSSSSSSTSVLSKS